MNRQQLAMRVQALSAEYHRTERLIDQRKMQRDQAQNRVNGIKNFLVGCPPNHPRAQQGRVQLVQAENLIREAGVRIQNGEQHLRQVEQQRTQAQQQLQRMQQGAQAQMAARGRGRGMMRGGW